MVFKPNVKKLKGKQDIGGLLRALQYRKEDSVRWEAADALGELEDPVAINSLIQALEDRHWRVRSSAAVALGIIGDSEAVEVLIKLVDH